MNLYSRPIAHRGLHNNLISENSMSAFRNAVEKNYNIEIDVHLLKDGNVVVFHDFSLKRMIGTDIDITSLTSEDLKKKEYLLPNGESIPLLKDLLEMVAGRVYILIEIKTKFFFNRDLEKALLLSVKGKESWVALQSFNPRCTAWLKHNAPNFNRGQLAIYPTKRVLMPLFYFFGPIASLRFTKVAFLAYNIGDLPSDRILEYVKKYNIKLVTWTIRTERDLAISKESHADNIIFEGFLPDNWENYPKN